MSTAKYNHSKIVKKSNNSGVDNIDFSEIYFNEPIGASHAAAKEVDINAKKNQGLMLKTLMQIVLVRNCAIIIDKRMCQKLFQNLLPIYVI